MADLWRNLRIGDRVRIVAWPPELHRDRLHPDTLEFYQWLIDTSSLLTIVEIDDSAMPWGETSRVVHGREQFEKVLLNHGGLETTGGTT